MNPKLPVVPTRRGMRNKTCSGRRKRFEAFKAAEILRNAADVSGLIFATY
jgi:hypothetical protein